MSLVTVCLGLPIISKHVYNHHWDEEAGFKEKMKSVFDLFAEQEEKLAGLLLEFLMQKKNVKIIGEKASSKKVRVATVSFVVNGVISNTIPVEVDKHKIAIRYGDFYARRLIESLGLMEQDGVIRVSMVHYNTVEEVNALIKVLDQIL